MAKHQKNGIISGIELAPPSLNVPKPPKAEEFIFSTIVALLGVFGTCWSFFSSFSIPVLPFTFVLYTVLFVAVCVTLFHLGRSRIYICLLLIVLYSFAGFVLRKELAQGFLVVTNQIMVTYARHSDYVLPIYDVAISKTDYAQYSTIFVLYAVFFVTIFLCWAIVRRQSAAIAIVVTLPFLLAALIFNIMPNPVAACMLLACWAALILIRMIGGKQTSFIKKRGSYRAKNPSAAARSGLRLLPVVLLCFALITALFPPQNYQYPPQAATLKQQMIDKANEFSLIDSGNTLAGSADRVNLRGADSIHFSGKTMLQVKTTGDGQNFSGYLKGFTGSVYSGTSWEPLSDSEFNKISGQLGQVNVQNYSSKFLSLINLEVPFSNFGIFVKNISANKKCIYSPYNLNTTPKDISGVKFVRDEVLRSSWLFGTGEYSLYGYSIANEQINSSPASILFSLLNKKEITDTKVGNDVQNLIGKYIAQSQVYNLGMLNRQNIASYYTDKIPDQLIQYLDDDARDFINSEQNYRSFMYDEYTKLPPELEKKVQNLLKEAKITHTSGSDDIGLRSYRSVTQMAQVVQNYLAKGYTYSLSPGKVPPGRDFADYFLFENNKGYCVHFATAATVMLRAMGVPARYAEGYIVTPDDYKSGVNGWANIKDNRAHAWVEIYMPGFGWQPFEMTPGFNVTRSKVQDDIQDPATTSSTPAQSGVNSEAESSTPESEPQGDTESGISSAPIPSAWAGTDAAAAQWPIFIVISAVILTIASISIRRRLAASRRKKLFTQSNANNAAIAAYDYILKLARFGGGIPENVTEIALKARFSQHTVSGEERNILLDYADLLVKNQLSGSSKAKILLLKYWYNLI